MKKIIIVNGTADSKNGNGSTQKEHKKKNPFNPAVQKFESWVLITNTKKTDTHTINKGAA